jgi:hypothetical protein
VLKSDILSIPDCLVPERSYTLSRAIAGIQLVPGEGKKGRLGDVSQLRPGSVLEFCGKGYDARTAKVPMREALVFVFLQDLLT